jgi:hypothetical protein
MVFEAEEATTIGIGIGVGKVTGWRRLTAAHLAQPLDILLRSRRGLQRHLYVPRKLDGEPNEAVEVRQPDVLLASPAMYSSCRRRIGRYPSSSCRARGAERIRQGGLRRSHCGDISGAEWNVVIDVRI